VVWGNDERQLFYIDRLAHRAWEKLQQALDGRDFEDVLDKDPDLVEQNSQSFLIARVLLHMREARAMINLLQKDPEASLDHVHQITWVEDSAKGLMDRVELRTESRSRAEMIERLEWISSENFGHDLQAWLDWIAAFEADPPPFPR
jgi:tRNA A37 N6-isopentenylltransferase MiaA